MARICFLTPVLFLSVAAFLLTSESSLIKVPQNHRAAGVFMLIEGGRYTLNFTAATAACLFLNVTIATRAQMERAVHEGLETCKFGWIHEKVAVVPRLKSDMNCGKGRTGVVPWKTNEDIKFAVYCFNASDLEEPPNTSPSSSQTSTPATALVNLTSTSPTSATTKAPEPTSASSASTLLVKTTHSARPPPTSPSLQPFSTHIPTFPHLIPSEPSVVSFTISTTVDEATFSVSSGSVLPQPVNSAKPFLGAIPTGLIVFGIVLLLLTAAGAVWYYKRTIFTLSHVELNDIETEMWKHTDSEMDIHAQPGGEEEEEDFDSDRWYSSEVKLCVNPRIKTHSSE